MDIVNSCCIFLWSGSISSVDKWTLIAVSLSGQDFHESVQLQVFREKGSFKTGEGFLDGVADSFVDFLPSL